MNVKLQLFFCFLFAPPLPPSLSDPAVDLKNGSGSVYPGDPQQGKSGCVFTVSDDDMMDLVTGKLDGQKVMLSQHSVIKARVHYHGLGNATRKTVYRKVLIAGNGHTTWDWWHS